MLGGGGSYACLEDTVSFALNLLWLEGFKIIFEITQALFTSH